MIWVHCKIVDDPRVFGNYVCKSNFDQENNENKSKLMKDESEDDLWIIETE